MIDNLPSTQFDILRHGECEGGNIFRGSTDVALLPEGREKMQQACDAIHQDTDKGMDKDLAQNWDVIVASPLIRCHHFAKEYAEQNGIELEIDERLREIAFGDWEAQEIEYIWNHKEDQMRQWMEDPSQYTPPNGEPLNEVYERVEEFFEHARQSYQGKRVLLVTHGGVIRVLLSSLLGMPAINTHRFDVPYACISRVTIFHMAQGDRIKLTAHNFV